MSPQAAGYVYAALGITPAVVEAVAANGVANQAAKLNVATKEGNAVAAARNTNEPIANPFTPKGVSFTEDLLNTNSAVKGMYNDYLAAFGGNAERATEFTARAVQSGESLPTIRIVGRNDELVRLIPVGDDAAKISSFYMSRAQYDMLSGTGKNAQQVAEALGLPAENYAAGGVRGFQAVSIQVLPGKIATVYESTIAPIEQGAFAANGKLKQLIVPNPSEFSSPKAIPGGNIRPVGRK